MRADHGAQNAETRGRHGVKYVLIYLSISQELIFFFLAQAKVSFK